MNPESSGNRLPTCMAPAHLWILPSRLGVYTLRSVLHHESAGKLLSNGMSPASLPAMLTRLGDCTLRNECA